LAYLRFLGEWYNLIWVGALCAGLLFLLARRSEIPAGPRASSGAVLVVSGVVGLTLNGALHDFRLGPIERWSPLVIPLSLGTGWLIARGASRLRHRWFPHVRAVAFNRPDLEGKEAVVLSADLEPGRIGRARHRDETGTSHIVRIHVADTGEPAVLRFGRRVRLGRFDTDRRSYPVDAARPPM